MTSRRAGFLPHGFRGRQYLRKGLISVLPAVVLILLVKGYPLLVAIYESFTNWDGLFRNDWVGLRNYVNILTGSQFWQLLVNNVVLLLIVPLQLILGFIYAILVYQEPKGWKFYRRVSLLPQVLSPSLFGFCLLRSFRSTDPLMCCCVP